MTKPRVPKASKKPVKRVTKQTAWPTRVRTALKVARAEEELEVGKVAPFPSNKPVGTSYIPTGSKSRWVKQEDEVWKEVKDG